MTYIQIIAIYQRFNRAFRSNDVDLFIYTLREMIPIYIAANRPIIIRDGWCAIILAS